MIETNSSTDAEAMSARANICSRQGTKSTPARTFSVRKRVTVSDIGRGIPPDDLECIFMPFVTSKTNGIGLGLAICGTIIRTHRGKLWAANSPLRGATLHFELPVELYSQALE